ncbi:MAG: hypothetical protein E6I02_08830 [Chloroflexi bacterium]|nr:MAG: hypothetical protein E6I02_08830 [Chloroflexota bacterium]
MQYSPHAFPALGSIALKKGSALLLTAAAMLAALFVAEGSAAPNSLTCEGYPQARVFVDAQSWWRTTPGMSGTDFGHVHVGGCIPERETLSENTQLDVRVMLHDNPGQLDIFELVYHGADYETDVEFPQTPPFTCPNPGTCERWLQVPVDLSLFNHAGLQELRFRAFEDVPGGNNMIASLDWQVYVENGATRMDQTRLAFPRGKGWYTGSGYCEAGYTGVPLPKAPLSGVWSPRLRMIDHGAIDDLPVTAYSVRLDPDFHADPMNEGTVLRDGLGEFPEQDVPIDTSLLPDGQHRLFLRADCDDPRGSSNSGVLVVNFTTANGSTPTASATPAGTPTTTPTATATPATATATPTATATATGTATATASPTATATQTSTATPTASPSGTATATPTPTATATPTAAPTETATSTATATPTASATPTSTASPTPGADSDGDGVPDLVDNCPNWPNPTQNLPPWLVPLNDPDCDGFSSAVEISAGTSPIMHCGLNAWPADINDDGFVDVIGDVTQVAGAFGNSVPPGPARYDIAPDPPDHFIDVIGDIVRLSGLFGQSCL